MKITTAPLELVQAGQQAAGKTGTTEQGLGFDDVLKNAIGEVNELQAQSADMKTKLVTGELDDIHQVMIAAEKANIALQMTVQIRNKVIEAYQEITRMQI